MTIRDAWAQNAWTRRTTSERASLIIIAVGCVYLGILAIWGQAPMESGDGLIFSLGTLAFGALFVFFAVPAALVVLVLGGAHFASPWRRALDRVLPLLALALLVLMLAGL